VLLPDRAGTPGKEIGPSGLGWSKGRLESEASCSKRAKRSVSDGVGDLVPYCRSVRAGIFTGMDKAESSTLGKEVATEIGSRVLITCVNVTDWFPYSS
jgi:hypothetical protein